MKKQSVCILDYGSGNVGSVYNLLSRLNYNIKISNESSDIKNSSHLILPGVGAFGDSIEKIKSKIPVDLLKDEVCSKKKPFLGICVGMQVLAEKGYEFGENDGLGWIKGTVKKLNAKMPGIPSEVGKYNCLKLGYVRYSRFPNDMDGSVSSS